ncbi:thioredoxin family protein [Azovibrio restrictus]|uniref:thioredoxin family protein n=1 Tax=Azovibrio restrictus TaxID=146938 RepID=UPI00041DDDB4|nr:thioredoxin fold domain-containing protein [Azovibrio restrictus]
MSLPRGLTLGLLLLCLTLPVRAALFENQGTALEQELAQARQSGRLLVVLFELENCPTCLQLKREVLSKPDAQRLFGRRFRTVTVNLDTQAEVTTPAGEHLPTRAWAQQIGVLGTPALVFFDARGQILYRHLGPVADCPELVLLGRFVADREFENQPYLAYLQGQFTQLRAKGRSRNEICHSKN